MGRRGDLYDANSEKSNFYDNGQNSPWFGERLGVRWDCGCEWACACCRAIAIYWLNFAWASLLFIRSCEILSASSALPSDRAVARANSNARIRSSNFRKPSKRCCWANRAGGWTGGGITCEGRGGGGWIGLDVGFGVVTRACGATLGDPVLVCKRGRFESGVLSVCVSPERFIGMPITLKLSTCGFIW